MSNLQPLLEKYGNNRVIRGLIQLMPFGIGGAIDNVLIITLEKIRKERAEAFFDELSKDDVVIDEALLESEDFIHAYLVTAKYALNSRRREKIRMFVRLLKNSLSYEEISNIDEYEDYLMILDNLGFRELQALKILDEYSNTPRDERDNDLQWSNKFWGEFERRLNKEVGIPEDSVDNFMNKISRTGCYELFMGGYYDHTGGQGKLTPTYHRLKKFIDENRG